MGSRVKRGDILGLIDDVLGREESEVVASYGGIVIVCAEIPLIHEGEARFHIARFEDSKEVAGQVESFHSAHAPDDLYLVIKQ